MFPSRARASARAALPVLLAAAAAAQMAPPATVPRAEALGGAWQALQADYARVARRVAPSVVTVRAFVRVPAPAVAAERAAVGATTVAVATGATASATSPSAPTRAAGWVAPLDSSDYPGFRLLGACSGFVVDASGEVLAVNHALRRPDGSLPDLIELETHDHARILAELVGAEPTVNLAILQATVFPNGHPRTLPPLTLATAGDDIGDDMGDDDAGGDGGSGAGVGATDAVADPDGALVCGHQLLAFGDPAGPERFLQVATFVAHPSRDCYQDLLSAFYMQVGMVAHPEAYGGPLVDLRGRVVGVLAPRQVATGVFAPSARHGVELALPSKIVAGLHESIRVARSFRSPWLGFAVASRAELASQRGLEAFQAMPKPRSGILIENVYQPGPAFEVGIQPGDFLVTFGKTRIFTPVDFQKALYLAGIGAVVELELWRDGATVRRQVIVQQRPAAATPR